MSLDDIKRNHTDSIAEDNLDPFSAFEEVNSVEKTKREHKFSKRTRNLILTSATALLLAVVLLILTLLPGEDIGGSSDTSTPTVDTTITLVDKSSDDAVAVKQVDIRNADDEYSLLYDTDSKQLIIKGYEDITVDEELSNTLIAYTEVITAVDKITSIGELKEYGLDQPAGTATVTYSDGSTVTVTVGNLTPSEDSYYARLSNDDNVYIIESDCVYLFLVRAAAFADITLLTTPTVKSDDANGVAVLKSVKYSGKNHSTPLSIRRSYYTDSAEMTLFSYIIDKPYVRGTSDDVSSLLGNFKSLDASQALYLHPTADQKKKLGFNDPLIVMDITMAVETAESEESSTTLDEEAEKKIYYNSYSTKLTVGSIDSNGNYVVMLEGINAIYLVEKSALSTLAERTYDNTVNQLLFLKNISELGRISITIDGEKHDFVLTHYPEKEDNDENMVVTKDGKRYPTADFRELYQQLMGLERYQSTSATYEKAATLQVDIYTTDGDHYLGATYYPLSGTLCAVETTEGEVFTTRWKNVTHFVEQIENYLNGEKVLILT